jgi:predicted Zn-dependent protease
MSQAREEQTSLLHQLSSEVTPEADPALRFILNNIKTISLSLGAVVLLTLKKQQAELGMIVATKSGVEKLQALDTFASGVSGKLQTAVNLEIARTGLELKQYDRAAAAYNAVIAHGEGPVFMARFGLAQALLQQDKAAEATDILMALAAEAPESFTVSVNRMLAEAAFEAGRYDQALAAFETLQGVVAADEKGYIAFRVQSLKQHMQSGS